MSTLFLPESGNILAKTIQVSHKLGVDNKLNIRKSGSRIVIQLTRKIGHSNIFIMMCSNLDGLIRGQL